MQLAALALDYDGTIARQGVFDPAVRDAIGEARRRRIAVILVTGRRLPDLRTVARDLTCFDAVVAENGAVVKFSSGTRRVVLAQAPSRAFTDELRRRHIPFDVGECVVETDAKWAAPILEVIRVLEQPLVVAFNRGRLMVLPQAIAKSTGLRHALFSLRISIHNTIGIGDAENDHDLLNACEVGVAVAWGSAALRAVADTVIEGSGPPAVADYIRRAVRQPYLCSTRVGRRQLMLGRESSGERVDLAVRGRTVLIAGEPGSGKSWLAGLVCEQYILQGYCLCIIDPEGDYRTLEALPGGIVLGGEDPQPYIQRITRALYQPDISVVLDLSKCTQAQKVEYVRTLLPLLMTLRRTTALPHGILLDEAHYFLSGADALQLVDPELAGYILVTYRISMLPASIRQAGDAIVIVTRETDPHEVETLRGMCPPQQNAAVTGDMFRDLALAEAALLPGTEEAHGRVRRFEMAPRVTPHVRHRSTYLDVPVIDNQAFVFADAGLPRVRVHTLNEFATILATLPPERLAAYLRREGFSRWIEGVFRDPVPANDVRREERRAGSVDPRTIVDAIAHAIRVRYETSACGGAAV